MPARLSPPNSPTCRPGAQAADACHNQKKPCMAAHCMVRCRARRRHRPPKATAKHLHAPVYSSHRAKTSHLVNGIPQVVCAHGLLRQAHVAAGEARQRRPPQVHHHLQQLRQLRMLLQPLPHPRRQQADQFQHLLRLLRAAGGGRRSAAIAAGGGGGAAGGAAASQRCGPACRGPKLSPDCCGAHWPAQLWRGRAAGCRWAPRARAGAGHPLLPRNSSLGPHGCHAVMPIGLGRPGRAAPIAPTERAAPSEPIAL